MSYIPRDFRKHLSRSPAPVITGGGFGTSLQLVGCPMQAGSWSGAANLTHPGLVREVQQQFVQAGVQVLATNSFRTAEVFIERMLKEFGLSASEFGKRLNIIPPVHSAEELAYLATKHAVDVAVEARDASSRPLFVAGSYGPLSQTHDLDRSNDPPIHELRESHARHARLLKGFGVDVLYPETIPTLNEAIAMAEAAEATGLQFVTSFVLNPETGNLFDHTPIVEAVRATESKNRVAVMFNCTPIETVDRALDQLLKIYSGFVGAYPNGNGKHGHPHEDGVNYVHNHSPESVHDFAHTVARFVEKAPDQVKLIGGCCGISPPYMAAVAEAVGHKAAPPVRLVFSNTRLLPAKEPALVRAAL